MEFKIVGNAIVATSKITESDYEMVKRSNPGALSIKDDKGNDVFTVSYNSKSVAGNALVQKYGITFNGKALDDNNNGYLTLTIPCTAEDLATTEKAKELTANIFEPVLPFISRLEGDIPAAAKAAKTAHDEFMNNIKFN